MIRTLRSTISAFAFAIALAPSIAAQDGSLAGLDAYITKALTEWQVPGLAIAVVRNDSVIYERGFGVREYGKPGKVDENTLFAIASTSKAFTVAALGTLVDEGKLDWDDHVSKTMPEFQLPDPFATRALTVRDLLTHRVGIPRSDNLWIVAPFDRAEILRRVRYLDASDAFRYEYGYNNLMFILAGELAGRVAATSWDDLVSTRIFKPLGMSRSTTRTAVANADGNVASSHVRVEGEPFPVKRRNYDNIGGAGAIFSSAHDMAQWIRMHLNAGTYQGHQVLKPATLREMYMPQTAMRTDTASERMFPTTHFRAYGLGWFLQDYHGRKLVHHSGSINQTRTHVAMIPEEKIGVVAMANIGSSNLQQALMYRVLDALMGNPPRDWSSEYLTNARRGDERSAAQARDLAASRLKETSPSLPLERYAGSYESEVYGPVPVLMEHGKLVLKYSEDFTADLEHWHQDTFVAKWRRAGSGRSFVTFSLDNRARVTGLDLDEIGAARRVRR